MNEDQLQELLREMREDAVPPDSLARVRSRVAQGTSRRASNPWRIPAFGLLAAGVLLVTLFFPATTPPPPLTRPSSALPQLTALAPEPDPERPAVPHRAMATHRARRRAQGVSVPVQIRIETDDPDIVILLTGE